MNNTANTGYVYKVTGVNPKSPFKAEIKSTLSHYSEVQQLKEILAHPTIIIGEDKVASMSLMMRRALYLLSSHQATLITKEDLATERAAYLSIAQAGVIKDRGES